MDITTFTDGTKTTLTLSGRLDTNTSLVLDEAIMNVIDDTEDLVLDFEGLVFISSTGLRVLMRALNAMDDKDGTMTLRNVCKDIMDVFQITGLTDMITIE